MTNNSQAATHSLKKIKISDSMSNEIKVFLKLIEAIRSTTDMDKIMEAFIGLTKTIFSYQGCGLYILNKRNNKFEQKKAVAFSDEMDQSLQSMIDDGIIDWVVEEGSSRIIPTNITQKDTLTKKSNFIVTPLLAGKGLIGVFIVLVPLSEEEISPVQLDNLFLLANQTASAVENSLLYHGMKRKIKELQVLFETGKSMGQTTELDNMLLLILNMATDVIKTEYSILFLVNGENRLIPSKSTGIKEKLLEGLTIKLGESISGWVAMEKQPIIIYDYNNDIRFQIYRNLLPFAIRNALSIPLLAKGKVVGVLTLYNSKDYPDFSDDDFRMLTVLAGHAGVAIERSSLYKKLREGYLDTIIALANAIEAKDPYTRGHAIRVTKYAVGIAYKLNLNKEEVNIIKYAGVLHDIGKIGIPEAILLKPSKLTQNEFKIIQQHPVLGEEIIKSVTFLKDAAPAIRYHHEYLDGKGYPEGLKGKNIPLHARILTVADAFDAMTSDRPYRKGIPQDLAIEELQRYSSKQFDFTVVTALVDVLMTNVLKGEKNEKADFKIDDIFNKSPEKILSPRD